MKKKRFTPEQISAILREYDNGKEIKALVSGKDMEITFEFKKTNPE